MAIAIFYDSAHICVAVFLPAYIYPISTLMSMCLKYNDTFELLLNSTSSKHYGAYGRFRHKDLLPRRFVLMLIAAVGLG